MKVEDRTYVISGGASGLGRACVENINGKGGYVAIIDMNANMAAGILEATSDKKVRFFQVNVTQIESIIIAVSEVRAWVQETGKAIGGIITAAGVSIPAKVIDRDMNPFSFEDFNLVMNVNVYGTIDLIRQFLPQFLMTEPVGKDGERGVIIMVSSVAAYDGQPGQVSYSASKGAISSLTLPLARDLSRFGIRVITIAPGLFNSGMTAMMGVKLGKSILKAIEFPSRLGEPHDFAQLARHAIENTMLNGVVLRLDGGIRLPSKM
ncbi:3-hydroxyacyl-CoA dehydrogenase type-2 [Golovinomyces cichoracearum]|uniref:3-hydroxyacyl-CoA dehydrogenase type-2 n=1 Tax=Golovinomyces cichoracearum TaxID=62708 RepID=A0A420ISJ0_9PEZI|nr:3-hydroxyacyl-CoA dehydrogenase type-2 [Golovinomyces cichoracearum]